jgi:tetratricopeptide (TPR) repeat protein
LTWALLLAACGGSPEEETTVAFYKDQAEQHAAAGRWRHAARTYRMAFALEDPRPVPDRRRAFLALKIGQSLRMDGQPEGALDWLYRAERLNADLYPIHFERGVIYDGTYPETVDYESARTSFGRYIEAVEARGPQPEEQESLELARKRFETLADEVPATGDAGESED